MEEINLKLKGRIVERYRTQERFSICCGRNANWISRLVRGMQIPTEAEKELIRVKLQIPAEEIDSYFQVGPESIRQS